MRPITKTILGMVASYILLSKKPTMNFERLTREMAKFPSLALKSTLSFTFSGFAFTLLAVAGIVVLFYDMGLYFNIYHRFGMTYIGGFSVILTICSLLVVTFLFRRDPYKRHRRNYNGAYDHPPQLSLTDRITDLIYENWRYHRTESHT